MGFLDSLQKLFGSKNKKIDIELRFERLRSAVSGTMSNFFVAKDREHEIESWVSNYATLKKSTSLKGASRGLTSPPKG